MCKFFSIYLNDDVATLMTICGADLTLLEETLGARIDMDAFGSSTRLIFLNRCCKYLSLIVQPALLVAIKKQMALTRFVGLISLVNWRPGDL